MDTLNIYEQYFEADLCWNCVQRHAVKVMLICESGQGNVRYDAAASFFPHEDEEDFAVSCDAYFSKTLCECPGRRSKAREAALLGSLREEVDRIAAGNGAQVFWEKPLGEARLS